MLSVCDMTVFLARTAVTQFGLLLAGRDSVRSVKRRRARRRKQHRKNEQGEGQRATAHNRDPDFSSVPDALWREPGMTHFVIIGRSASDTLKDPRPRLLQQAAAASH